MRGPMRGCYATAQALQNVLMYIGGYAGLVTSVMAFYLSGAIVINSAFKREVLPVFAVAQSH